MPATPRVQPGPKSPPARFGPHMRGGNDFKKKYNMFQSYDHENFEHGKKAILQWGRLHDPCCQQPLLRRSPFCFLSHEQALRKIPDLLHEVAHVSINGR